MELMVIVCVISIVATTFVVGFFFRHRSRLLASGLENEVQRCRYLEKTIHNKESAYLEARNLSEVDRHAELMKTRELGLEKGIEIGRQEREKDHLVELTNLRAEHRAQISVERDDASQSARSILRAELEAQTKMFSVVIRPYVKIQKDTGLIWDEHKSYVGYQYQLLVNGIPAFQPHVVVEKTEELKEVDKQVILELVKIAEKAAQVAANTYLNGASNSVLKIGTEIVEQIKS